MPVTITNCVPQKLSANDTEIESSAEFSPCRSYRYALERRWDDAGPTVAFIGLNPSTADEQSNDPTIRRCIGFAQSWGFGSLSMVNLFAMRSKDPRLLYEAEDPIGPDNDRWIEKARRRADALIAAWGTRGTLLGRDESVLAKHRDLLCLGVTKDGHPRHPLYLRSDTTACPFRP